MATYKHLTLSEREIIERLLKEEYSFKAIARELNQVAQQYQGGEE